MALSNLFWNESINIVMTFKHNYRMKLFVVWDR